LRELPIEDTVMSRLCPGRAKAGSEAVTITPVPGDDVVLTLDRSVQYEVEQAMLDQVTAVEDDSAVPPDALLREFIGGSVYKY
jgi:cell division protein FtsI/penicillin-binding protein 2